MAETFEFRYRLRSPIDSRAENPRRHRQEKPTGDNMRTGGAGRLSTAGVLSLACAFGLLDIGTARQAGAQAAPALRTAPVSTTTTGGEACVGGTLIPFKEVTLTAQVPGRVTFIAGSEGHGAEAGAVLMQIDDDGIQARRRAALAQIAQAEATLRNSQMQYSRELCAPRVDSITGFPGMGIPNSVRPVLHPFFTRGFANSFGNSNTVLERQADLYARGVGINQAQARLEALDAQARDTKTPAPFEGVIIRKHVETGDTVQPGTSLPDFAHVEYLRIEAEVPVRLAAGLDIGMIVPARLDVGGMTVDARVAQIFPVADPRRHTVRVKFDLPADTPGGPGTYAERTLPDPSVPLRTEQAIPAEAPVWRGSLPAVFVLEEGRPSLRLVRVGYPLADGRILVISRLKGTEQVILDPPADLVSGKAAAGE